MSIDMLERAWVTAGIIGGGSGGGGSVTSITAGGGLSGGTITTTGTIAVNESVNAQTGTSYTLVVGDLGKLVTLTNASAIALTSSAAATLGAGWFVDVANEGAGTVTFTPGSGTIDGGATLVLTTNQGVRLVTDGTNFFSIRGLSSPSALTFESFSGTGPFTAAGYNYFTEVSATAASVVLNIPTPVGNVGKYQLVSKIDATTGFIVSITPAAGTIAGQATYQLQVQYDTVLLISDGTNWVPEAQWPALAPTTAPGDTAFTVPSISGLYKNTTTLTANRTWTLPSAASVANMAFLFEKGDSSTFSVILSSTDTINGSTTKTLAAQYDACIIRSNGTSYDVIADTAQGAEAWTLVGNTVGATKTIGTIDNFAFPIITNNTTKLTVASGATPTLTSSNGNFLLTTNVATETQTIGNGAGTGTITIGSSTATQIVAIGDGTGAAANVNIANTTSTASTVNIGNGTGGNTIAIGTGANTIAQIVNIANGAGSGSSVLNLAGGAKTGGATVSIANGAFTTTAVSVSILNNAAATANASFNLLSAANTATSSLTILNGTATSGTQTVSILGGGGTPNATISICGGTAPTGGTRTVNLFGTGAVASTDTLNLFGASYTAGATFALMGGTPAAASTINILSGIATAGTQAFNLATGATTQTVNVNIGTGTSTAGAKTITVGSVDNFTITNHRGNQAYSVVLLTATGSVAASTRFEMVNGTVTRTMPASSGTGRIITVKNTGTGSVTVAFNGAEHVDSGSTFDAATVSLTSDVSQDFIDIATYVAATPNTGWQRI